jgi:hypothetical protein
VHLDRRRHFNMRMDHSVERKQLRDRANWLQERRLLL